jgi:hypothetical protein
MIEKESASKFRGIHRVKYGRAELMNYRIDPATWANEIPNPSRPVIVRDLVQHSA